MNFDKQDYSRQTFYVFRIESIIRYRAVIFPAVSVAIAVAIVLWNKMQ